MGEIKIENLAIGALKAYANNPRKNEAAVEAVAESIREFGFRTPILIDRDNVIIAGHTRLKAAKRLKLEMVPCIRIEDLTPEQVRGLRIADNSSAALSDWNVEKLINELRDLSFDFELLGLPEKFLNLPRPIGDDDQFDIAEALVESAKETCVKPGEVWKLGDHRLMCGDACNADSVELLTGGVNISMYLTDPPYNVDYVGKTSDALKIKNDKMDSDSFLSFLTDAFIAANKVLRPGGAFYIWHADTERVNFQAAMSAVGWRLRQVLIWCKNMLIIGRQDYQWKHEPCLYGEKDSDEIPEHESALYGWKNGARHSWFGGRKQPTVIECNKPVRNAEHPTMKPVELFAYLIKNSTRPDDAVLDSFAGSGTTIIACEQLKRRAFCMEFDPIYCDVIIKRWEALTGREAVLVLPAQ